MTTTYVAQSGTACGHKESRMLRLAAAGSSAERLSSQQAVLQPILEGLLTQCCLSDLIPLLFRVNSKVLYNLLIIRVSKYIVSLTPVLKLGLKALIFLKPR